MDTPFSVILPVSLLFRVHHLPNKLKGVLLMFGGSNQVEFSNEVFILDWQAKEWKMIQEGSDGGGDSDEGKKAPLRRNFHTAAFHHNPNR